MNQGHWRRWAELTGLDKRQARRMRRRHLRATASYRAFRRQQEQSA